MSSRATRATSAAPRARTAAPRAPFLSARFTVPSLPTGLVERRRLLDLMHRGSAGPLTLVSAPAGTGKTVLVSSWAAGLDPATRLAWVSLDKVDLDAATVWSCVVEGLRRAGVEVLPRVPVKVQGTADGSFLHQLAGQISTGEPLTLVLDCDGSLPADFADGLDYVLRNSGDRLHLVLLGRVDPLFPFHRYRLTSTLVEIRLAQLAFTTDEAHELLTGMGVPLAQASAAALTDRTHGWAAGLRFAGMSLAHQADPEAAVLRLTGDSGTVAEYLLAEVLNAQPDGARDLLLSTSVVDVLQPGLVRALAGPQAQRALAFLVHGNAFIEEAADAPGCYTYHPLFRELLRAQLSYEAPQRALDLHRVAARWMAAHDQLEGAVRHAMAAADWEQAASYVVDDLAVAQLMVERAPGRLRELLTHVPAEAVGLCTSLVRAALAMAAFDVEACRRHVSEAEVLRHHGGTARRSAVDLAFEAVFLASNRDVADAPASVAAATEAERLIRVQPADRLAAHPELVGMVQSRKGRALLACGQLEAAATAFAAGAETAERSGCEYPVLSCLGHLALIAALNGQLRKAEAFGEQAVRLQSDAGIPRIWCPPAPEVALAWVHTETYDLAGARRHALRAAESADIDPLPRAMLTLVNARLSRARGDVDQAHAVLADAGARAEELPVWLQDALQVEEAGLDLVDGEPALARRIAEAVSERTNPAATLVLAQAMLATGTDVGITLTSLSGRAVPLHTRVGGLLLEASHQLSGGHEQRATAALERSLRLAAPEQLRRPFREAPAEVRRLLRRDIDVADRHRWLGGTGKVTSAPPPIPRQPAGGREAAGDEEGRIVEPLTEREREVLGHLAELLTTNEIAGVMFVSVNTVRTHVRNILRKLDASRRNEAVRRARALRILRD